MKRKIIIISGISLLLFIAYFFWQANRAGGIDEIVKSVCAENCHYYGTDYSGEKDLTMQPGAQIGNFTLCPVSKVVIKVNEASLFIENKKGKYYVCCNICWQLAENNPEKYF